MINLFILQALTSLAEIFLQCSHSHSRSWRPGKTKGEKLHYIEVYSGNMEIRKFGKLSYFARNPENKKTFLFGPNTVCQKIKSTESTIAGRKPTPTLRADNVTIRYKKELKEVQALVCILTLARH